MSEENKAEQTPESTQVEPMPSSEQTQEAEVKTEEVVQEPIKEQAVTEQGVTEADLELSREVSNRTREQFNKLREQLNYYKNQNTANEQKLKSLYDEDTGLINKDGLNSLSQTAYSAEQRARAAEDKLNRYLDSLQEREAYQEFPELDPNNAGFDRDLHKAVRGYITDSMVNPMDYGGKELTMAEAARLITNIANKKAKKVEKQVAKEVVSKLTPKEEASLEAKGKSDRAPIDMDNIRERSRKGDRLATIERLKRLSQ